MHSTFRNFVSSLLMFTICACGNNTSNDSDGGATPADSADFEPPKLTLAASSAIPTVVIAQWSTSEFGLDEMVNANVRYTLKDSSVTLVAPVDLERDFVAGQAALTFRTPLLGMKQLSDYAVHVDIETTSGAVQTEEVAVRTGFLPSQIPRVSVADTDATKLQGGFTVACTGPGGGEAWAFIWDRDGDVVWAHSLSETTLEACTRARLSFDGRALWVGDLNLAGVSGGLAKLDMAGEHPPISYELPGRHHDFAILPNGNILYFKEEESEPAVLGAKRDVLYEFDPATEHSELIYDELTDFAAVIGDMPAHTNYVAFVPHLNAISFSMLTSNTIAVVSYPEGELLATFGGTASNFDMSWTKQHGHEVSEDELLVFSNQGPDLKSIVLAYDIDLEASTSTPGKQYVSTDQTATFGDVKRLPNGNVLVTYSNAGAIHELDRNWELLRRTETVGVGYVEHRSTLYGPPPPFAE